MADPSLRRWLERPEELLLAELGRASRIYPELASGLRTARPSNLCLDTEGAYHFLSTAAALLDEAGFGVLLPSWWDRRRKLGLALSAYTPVDGVVAKASRFGRDQLVEFRWELAVGDDTLTEDEIAALAETKAPQRHQDPGTGPTLLLCPMSLVGNWQREAAKFAPGLRVYPHHGGARLHGDALCSHLEDTDLVVTTYATATRDIDELAGYGWNRVVLDEAQAVHSRPARAGKPAGGVDPVRAILPALRCYWRACDGMEESRSVRNAVSAR